MFHNSSLIVSVFYETKIISSFTLVDFRCGLIIKDQYTNINIRNRNTCMQYYLPHISQFWILTKKILTSSDLTLYFVEKNIFQNFLVKYVKCKAKIFFEFLKLYFWKIQYVHYNVQ